LACEHEFDPQWTPIIKESLRSNLHTATSDHWLRTNCHGEVEDEPNRQAYCAREVFCFGEHSNILILRLSSTRKNGVRTCSWFY
jgi:hypothetical protein